MHTVLLDVLDGVVRVHVDGARGAFGGGAGKAGLDEVAVCTFVLFDHVGGDVGAAADDDDLEDDGFRVSEGVVVVVNDGGGVCSRYVRSFRRVVEVVLVLFLGVHHSRGQY